MKLGGFNIPDTNASKAAMHYYGKLNDSQKSRVVAKLKGMVRQRSGGDVSLDLRLWAAVDEVRKGR